MLDLERQVEQMKEREWQKAVEIQKWKDKADDLDKDTMKLKKQLAVAMDQHLYTQGNQQSCMSE